MAQELSPSRIVSLDQFRGYTVLGMFLVNFAGSYAAVRAAAPVLAHHHTYFSYADSIMPQFFFAVGFAYRLTFLRRAQTRGLVAAYSHALRRNAALLLVAFVIHTAGSGWQAFADHDQLDRMLNQWAKRELFQTLTHIAITSVWVLPVIAAPPGFRVGWMVASGAVHLALSYAFNYRWVNTAPVGIDGGPLGFLTWTIPLLAGSLAYDAWTADADRVRVFRRLIAWGVLVMGLGYGLSCQHLAPFDRDEGSFRVTVAAPPPPFVHVEAKAPTNDVFTMSQRSGSATYLTFGAGFSLAVYALFVLACDVGGWQLGLFRTLGVNALVGYILHDLVNAAVRPFVPKDSPVWYVLTGCAVSITICYLLLRGLEKQRIYLKL
ncbi:MAG TPA: heparan-alpha-glucosaminide N-acetyltransferase domain-containing protein [Gemmataceae bacterium]|nr:heparan-alpha-glucosaminide N-acetyltransferase domain-containing protein [Gemmataceae bacterium]